MQSLLNCRLNSLMKWFRLLLQILPCFGLHFEIFAFTTNFQSC
jgi:hypothetical protein